MLILWIRGWHRGLLHYPDHPRLHQLCDHHLGSLGLGTIWPPRAPHHRRSLGKRLVQLMHQF
jgi:hypothetical protein